MTENRSQHTWKLAGDAGVIQCENPIAAQRIQACVAACEGIADPSVVPEMVKFLWLLRRNGPNTEPWPETVRTLDGFQARIDGSE